jgi:cyanophycinase-like exopeptidase
MDGAGVNVVAIIGSGETSPTMVSIHRRLIDRLPGEQPRCVLLQTPYAFQANVDDVSAKARAYFARSVGIDVSALAGTAAGADADRDLATVRSADWLFAGPGSPSYALRHWLGGPVAQAMRDRLRLGRGVTVLASAAAAVIGRLAVPVYEIYKAGTDAHWLEGLDLLGGLGLSVAVIPHFDNTEGGGKFDTRYCYLGAPRLAVMESQLPDDITVLGVDEHTAVIVDVPAGTVEIAGRGGLTVRRHGDVTVLPAGTTTTLADLIALTRGQRRADPAATPRDTGTAGDTSTTGDTGTGGTSGDIDTTRDTAADSTLTLREIVTGCEQRFAAADSVAAMTEVILELEAAIHEWSGDTDEDDGVTQARAVLRSLIVRLGDATQAALSDPREPLTPLVERLVALRGRLRTANSFAAADALRDVLAATGAEVRDTDGGTVWTWRDWARLG